MENIETKIENLIQKKLKILDEFSEGGKGRTYDEIKSAYKSLALCFYGLRKLGYENERFEKSYGTKWIKCERKRLSDLGILAQAA